MAMWLLVLFSFAGYVEKPNQCDSIEFKDDSTMYVIESVNEQGLQSWTYCWK